MRERPNANTAVRLERHEPERREPPQRFPHGRARDSEPLRQLLLAEHGAGRELARDDRLLDETRDVVGLRALERHYGSRSYASRVRKSFSGTESATSRKTSFASSDASTRATSSRTCASSKRPDCTHDHTCARETSAVAASSMRLSIAAAPTPCSHASTYLTPTLTFTRKPASVTS